MIILEITKSTTLRIIYEDQGYGKFRSAGSEKNWRVRSKGRLSLQKTNIIRVNEMIKQDWLLKVRGNSEKLQMSKSTAQKIIMISE